MGPSTPLDLQFQATFPDLMAKIEAGSPPGNIELLRASQGTKYHELISALCDCPGFPPGGTAYVVGTAALYTNSYRSLLNIVEEFEDPVGMLLRDLEPKDYYQRARDGIRTVRERSPGYKPEYWDYGINKRTFMSSPLMGSECRVAVKAGRASVDGDNIPEDWDITVRRFEDRR